MLPTELLMQRYQGEEVIPKRLPCRADHLAIAAELMALFQAATGSTRAELQAQRHILEGEETDYRMKRGLAPLLETAFSTFEMRSPLDPATLRERVFALSAQSIPGPQSSAATLAAVAEALGHELEREVGPEQIRAWLYADPCVACRAVESWLVHHAPATQ